MPFYDQPGTHVTNLAIGASAGAVVGLGVWIYGRLAGSPGDEMAAFTGRDSHFQYPPLDRLNSGHQWFL